MTLAYGADFADAAEPLRILAPVVVMLGLVTLCSSLIISRRSPRTMVPITAAMVAVNVVLNLVLIPSLEDDGAAIGDARHRGALHGRGDGDRGARGGRHPLGLDDRGSRRRRGGDGAGDAAAPGAAAARRARPGCWSTRSRSCSWSGA